MGILDGLGLGPTRPPGPLVGGCRSDAVITLRPRGMEIGVLVTHVTGLRNLFVRSTKPCARKSLHSEEIFK